MTDGKKRESHFTLIPIIEITEAESSPFSSRSTSQIEQPLVTQEKSPISLPRVLKLVPYTPPDSLMFPLFSAIQRKAWTQARRLCHELLLCDPGRPSYQDLYLRLQQIITLADRRVHSYSTISKATTANSDREKSSQEQSQSQ